MDFQLIATYLIISAAVGYSLYQFYRVISPSKDTSFCGGCGSCDIKKELMKNKIRLDRSKLTDNSEH